MDTLTQTARRLDNVRAILAKEDLTEWARKHWQRVEQVLVIRWQYLTKG